MLSQPRSAAIGMVASSSARAMSLMMRTGRRCILSIHAPAGRPMSAKATVDEAETIPTSSGEASSSMTASSGMATALT
jgi:hypothetical protein